MKILLNKVVNAIPVLEQIKNKRPSFKIDYWAMRNIKILSDSYNFFITKREELFQKYCDSINGSYFTYDEHGNVLFNLKNKDDGNKFTSEMTELLNMPCEDVSPYLLSLTTITLDGDFHLDNEQDIFAIDYLLSE